MAAIAESEDVYAWLIRGFVESGLPDHSAGGRAWLASGALNLESFLPERGAGGIVLEFAGQAHDAPVPEDEYSYQVLVERGPDGGRIVVRSEDTLFYHVFSSWGGGAPPPRNAPPSGAEILALASHILAEVRAHNTRFTEWRAEGGTVSIAQRRGLPPAQGAGADRALLAVFETLRRTKRSIAEGPANKWWVKAGAAAGPLKIEAGQGLEPQYVTRKSVVRLSPEDLEHADRLHTAGMLLYVSTGVSLLVFLVATIASGWNLWSGGTRWLFAQGWTTVASVGVSFVFAGLHLVAGYKLRALRSRRLVLVLTILGMLPCFAPCCVGGFPVGAWVLYLLRDERTSKVFNA